MSLLPEHFVGHSQHAEIARLFNDIRHGLDKNVALHRMTQICIKSPGAEADQLRSHIQTHYKHERRGG